MMMMKSISNNKKMVYVSEVFVYCIVFTYCGFIVSRILDNFMNKVDEKINNKNIF